MARFDRMVDRLPSLFRPQPGASDLTTLLVGVVGQLMDDISRDMADLMQAHWYNYADQARYSAYFTGDRERLGLPPADPTDANDRQLLQAYPYLLDLARLGSLLALPAWREPAPLRERVEAYRTRLGRFVAMYRNGLGTVEALRAVVELELPADLGLPQAQQERSFSIEECTPLMTTTESFKTRGTPEDLAGPLMRWSFANDGANSTVPTLYLQGLAPNVDTDATQRPMLERFDPQGDLFGVGLAYNGTLAEGQTLRLRPVHQSWLGREGGLEVARSAPTESSHADPTAAGPWQASAGSPTGAVTAIHQSADHVLWVAVDDAGTIALWRHDGLTWNRVLEALVLAPVHFIISVGQDLVIGTDSGLLTMPLYPAEGEPFAATPVSELGVIPVFAALKLDDGSVWLGTQNGARWVGAEGEVVLTPLEGTAIHAIATDRNGALYFGGELGLFQYQSTGTPPAGSWYWYRGEKQTDQAPDWEFLDGGLPTADQVYLSPVTALGVSADGSLWIGTQDGLCRYLARHVKALAYRTELEAYPDLTDGRVYAIEKDARGRLWFATSRGLFRYDGRDLAQHREADGRWLSHGRADHLYVGDQRPEPRGTWRFNRNLGGPTWERYEGEQLGWQIFAAELRGEAEPLVGALAWSDTVVADLGGWDGETFTHDADVDPAELRMRCKPEETRIVDGGIPAVPRLPPGQSVWRYLSMEPDDLTPPEARPWWSTEGRLLPEHDGDTAYAGRYGSLAKPTAPESLLDQIVFPYRPAARVWFRWRTPRRFTVVVRLHRRSAEESIDPAILDRVWRGMDRVRPAGVRVLLALEEQVLRGE